MSGTKSAVGDATSVDAVSSRGSFTSVDGGEVSGAVGSTQSASGKITNVKDVNAVAKKKGIKEMLEGQSDQVWRFGAPMPKGSKRGQGGVRNR